MNVYLSFDVEIWCNNWNELDERFPSSFERYIYGRSRHGDYALPETLATLLRHGLRGVFFVEPLFSARFGQQYLQQIAHLIEAADQDVQLHLHPEWTDEIRPPIIADIASKRQHLSYYTLEEQTALIGFAKQALEGVASRPVTAFRAGSYAANRDTYEALRRNGILVDSSLNEHMSISGADLPRQTGFHSTGQIGTVSSYPVTVFRDGFGRPRPAHLSACSFAELRGALLSAQRSGCEHFVIVSHNFELLKPASSEPDRIMVRRFERLCHFLAAHPREFKVGSYPSADAWQAARVDEQRPQVSPLATATRYAEQLARRLA